MGEDLSSTQIYQYNLFHCVEVNKQSTDSAEFRQNVNIRFLQQSSEDLSSSMIANRIIQTRLSDTVECQP